MGWIGGLAPRWAPGARVLLSAACGAGLLAAAGCTAPIHTVPLHTSAPCMPPAYTLDATAVAPGQTLGISAPAATCNPSYGKDARVGIELVDDRQQVVLSTLAPMADDGSFAFDLRIPEGTTPGAYGIIAMPYGLDWCDDTGSNNRLDGAEAPGWSAVRVSCAQPRVGFQVTG